MPFPPCRRASQVSTVYTGEDLEVYPVIEDEGDVEAVELLEGEMERLDADIAACTEPNPFLLARRGALCRKVRHVCI